MRRCAGDGAEHLRSAAAGVHDDEAGSVWRERDGLALRKGHGGAVCAEGRAGYEGCGVVGGYGVGCEGEGAGGEDEGGCEMHCWQGGWGVVWS